MNLNALQILAIIIAILSFMSGATAQLTDLFGPLTAKTIVSAASFLGGILGSIVAVLTSQAAQVRNVAAMPGVSSIVVNPQASAAVAAVAVDPAQSKVGGATPDVQETLKAIAKGA